MISDEIRFHIFILRRFGLHPEILNDKIVVPDIEKKEAERLLVAINNYQPKDLNGDLTEIVNHFIIGI